MRPERGRGYARGPAPRRRPPRTSWLAALAIAVVAVTTAAGWQGDGRPGRPASEVMPLHATERATTDRPSPISPATSLATSPAPSPAPSPPATSPSAVPTPARLALSASARRSCPHAASACVDLGARLTWLQSDGTITYGPVRMEPGPPGTPHKTPRGTFHVEWKAGPNFVSTQYHEPMPYAVFSPRAGSPSTVAASTRRRMAASTWTSAAPGTTANTCRSGPRWSCSEPGRPSGLPVLPPSMIYRSVPVP